MTATDSVLEALLPQLNSDFDRTLLLVIADRCDEIAEGSGEGWWVLWEFGCKPANYYYRCYYWGGKRSSYNTEEVDTHILPELWFDALYKHRTYFDIILPEYRTNIADFKRSIEAYTAAATEWCTLTPDEKAQCLKELQ